MKAGSWAIAALLTAGLCLGLGSASAQSPPPMPLPAWGDNDPIVTFEDALLALRPSEEVHLRLSPRDSLPKETYFRWSGRITAMESSEGPYAERADPFRGSRKLQGWRFMVFLCLEPPAPFAFRDIRRAYAELEPGQDVEVIGRYAGVIQVERPHQEIITMPLLDNCYVR